jgi:hypothetical protein
MRDDPDLWTGCISGAFQEQDFLQAFADAGFHGIELVKRGEEPWRVVEGIEFHSVTVLAHKGKEGPCFEHKQAVVYKGPFSAVHDDDGHTFVRGERAAVCDKTFKLLQRGPYQDRFYFVEPRVPIAPEDARPFDCSRTAPRHPRETKGEVHDLTTEASNCCEPGDAC